MICPECKIDIRPWFDTAPSSAGCRIIGIRCGGCDSRWISERLERIYDDLHYQSETVFRKMLNVMDFPTDARKEGTK